MMMAMILRVLLLRLWVTQSDVLVACALLLWRRRRLWMLCEVLPGRRSEARQHTRVVAVVREHTALAGVPVVVVVVVVVVAVVGRGGVDGVVAVVAAVVVANATARTSTRTHEPPPPPTITTTTTTTTPEQQRRQQRHRPSN